MSNRKYMLLFNTIFIVYFVDYDNYYEKHDFIKKKKKKKKNSFKRR